MSNEKLETVPTTQNVQEQEQQQQTGRVHQRV